MTAIRWRATDTAPAGPVPPVEAFFDVVFVFTLTQLTRTLERELTLAGAGRTLLLFSVLGLGYLLVICVHLTLFTQSDVLGGVMRLAPFNITSALLVLVAGFVDVAPAEQALGRAEPAARSLLAIRAYFFAHILLLLGVIAAAAGIHEVIAHPAEPAKTPTAIALAGRIALFLVGVAEVRHSLAIGSARNRLIAATALLATIPLGTRRSAWLHLASVVSIVAVMLVIDARQRAASNRMATHDLGLQPAE